ncbi:MAG TPA: DUF4136 domain-containing protein [Planctomycetota bacterium]
MKNFAAILVLAAGCSGVSTSTDYDPQADFSRLRTYDWLPGRPQTDSLTDARIARAVDDGLLARGYARAPRPDFHVAYQVSVGRRVDSIPGSYGWRGGYGTEVHTYDEGTLVLDVIEPTSKTLLWRGTATSVVDPNRTPEERDAKIREAVEKLLAKFPPGGARRPAPTP